MYCTERNSKIDETAMITTVTNQLYRVYHHKKHEATSSGCVRPVPRFDVHRRHRHTIGRKNRARKRLTKHLFLQLTQCPLPFIFQWGKL